jgi:PiT family inorganic phosphate transporter
MILAWVLTIPMAGAIGAATYGVTRLFGTGAVGPVVVSLLGIGLTALVFLRRVQRGSPITAGAS